MKYHFTPVRMAPYQKNTRNSKCCYGCDENVDRSMENNMEMSQNSQIDLF